RRVQIARALMVKPKVAVLDEPTAGLDVIQAKEVREVVKKYSAELGTTVLVSSHNMLEVEDLCGRVAMIHGGVVVKEGFVSDLLKEYGARNLEEVFFQVVGGGAR
ncbi:MAG: multidrug ABC transporter ATP-binding protein, partial [Thermofilum sp.]